MDGTEPHSVFLGSALTNDPNYDPNLLHGFPVASSSNMRVKDEMSVSDNLYTTTCLEGSFLSRGYEGNSQEACMYYENNVKTENTGLDINEEEDEGLYLALNSMPVKVELEEDSAFEGKPEMESFQYGDQSSDQSFHSDEKGIASASWYDTHYMVNSVEPEQGDSSLPNHKKRTRKSYLRDEERRERERLARKRLMAKERASKYRNSLSAEQLEVVRQKGRERARERRMLMSEEECVLVRLKNRENAQMRRNHAKEMVCSKKMLGLDSDEEKALIIRLKNRERMRLKRQNMSEEEKVIERKKNRERVRRKRQIQKAESLLKKLINAHSDVMRQTSLEETKHFLQTVVDKNKVELPPEINE